MNQINTGKFIQQKRKERNLTQQELADKLSISYKTVSKWETGKGLPEVGIMLDLCNILGISVNELLSGKSLKGEEYLLNAEENMLSLIDERRDNKKKIVVQIMVFVITVLSVCTLICVAALSGISTTLRIVLIVISLMIAVLGVSVGCILDRETGFYECKYCGKRFIPSMKDYVKGVHGLSKRWLRCPSCGKKGFFSKKLSEHKTND